MCTDRQSNHAFESGRSSSAAQRGRAVINSKEVGSLHTGGFECVDKDKEGQMKYRSVSSFIGKERRASGQVRPSCEPMSDSN